MDSRVPLPVLVLAMLRLARKKPHRGANSVRPAATHRTPPTTASTRGFGRRAWFRRLVEGECTCTRGMKPREVTWASFRDHYMAFTLLSEAASAGGQSRDLPGQQKTCDAIPICNLDAG